jgi:plasmid stability protein
MSTLQIRDVPEEVKRVLKTRAAAAGQSLSEYALGELSKSARTPTFAELSDRIDARGRVDIGGSAAEILRAERDAR